MLEAFQSLDEDNDGKLSKEELINGIKNKLII